jgi:hypothetical protein
MTKRILTLLAVGVLAAAPVALHAQSISLAGGISQPNGDLSNGVGSGYNATLGLNFGAPLIPVGARIEGGLNGFNYKGGASGDVRIMNVTANGIFNLGMPYLIGGLGYYNRRINQTVLGTKVTDTQSAAGINVGGGVRFPLGTLSPFAEVRYHAMLGDKSKAANFQFIPITFGVQF